MNKYPLDLAGIQNILGDLARHNEAQEETIQKLVGYLRETISYVDHHNDIDVIEEAQDFLRSMNKRTMDFSNLRFDQQNGHKTEDISPYNVRLDVTPGQPIDAKNEAKLNSVEAGFGDTMTEEELAVHFGEPLPKKAKKKKAPMSPEEIESWEAAQNNSNDIYKISARVKNLARAKDASLTTVGVALCNVYTHVLKAFYDFADAQDDKETKIKLTDLIRKQEEMPANFIAAVHAKVKIEE